MSDTLEETGYKPGSMEYLGDYRKDAYMNAIWHVFLAAEVRGSRCEAASFVLAGDSLQ